MIYFTSDLHLGHENVLKWRKGFSTIEEMDNTLISNWNHRVHANDCVIITGDLIFRNKHSAEEYLSSLNGRKILVKGNHDAEWLKDFSDNQIGKYFEGIYDFYSIKRNGVRLRFCHYPMIAWEHSRQGSILICGHIHDKTEGLEPELFSKIPYSFNAGVDINGFAPATLSEMVKNNISFYGKPLDENQQEELLEKCCLFEEIC